MSIEHFNPIIKIEFDRELPLGDNQCCAITCNIDGDNFSMSRCDKPVIADSRSCDCHRYYGSLTDDQVHEIDLWLDGDESAGVKLCANCRRFTFCSYLEEKGVRGVITRCIDCLLRGDVQVKRVMSKCCWYDVDGKPCQTGCANELLYCDLHAYVSEYTEKQKAYENCKGCKQCGRWVSNYDGSACPSCLEANSKLKDTDKLCKEFRCPNRASFHSSYPEYCQKHQIDAWRSDVELDGKAKLCSYNNGECRNLLPLTSDDHCIECMIAQYPPYLIDRYTKSKNGPIFALPHEYAFKLIYQNCFYCGNLSATTINEIDRIDNGNVYNESNSVPCCDICKTVKGAATYDELIRYCNNIANKYGSTVNWAGAKRSYDTYSIYKSRRAKKGVPFELTINEYDRLLTKRCFYCQGSNCATNIGVDMLDPTIGYTVDNCVPCCKVCEAMKGKMLAGDFVDHIEKITMHNNAGIIGIFDHYNRYEVKRCRGYNADKEECKNRCPNSSNYCIHHRYCEKLDEKGIDKLKFCSKCSKYHDGKYCKNCVGDSRVSIVRLIDSDRCSSVMDSNLMKPCGEMKVDGSDFCQEHRYLGRYTDEQLMDLVKCSGCKIIRYTDGNDVCADCRKKKKEKEKQGGRKKLAKGRRNIMDAFAMGR
jgi:hypothetical protein